MRIKWPALAIAFANILIVTGLAIGVLPTIASAASNGKGYSQKPNETRNQIVRLSVDTSDSQSIQNKGTGTCITSLGATSNGSPAELYTCNGSANQDWRAIDKIGNTAVVLKNIGDGLCLNNSNGVTENYNPQTMWRCNGGANELYAIYNGSENSGLVGFVPTDNDESCNGTDDACAISSLGNAANYARIELYTLKPDNNQLWGFPDL